MNKNQLLFLTILLEGYVVLACELIAIRTLIPFVGSGTEVISIVISAVLLPLAAGYHIGGQRFQKAQKTSQRPVSIRKILLRNLLNAMVPLAFGLSYFVQEVFFTALTSAGIMHHIPQAALFCLVFLVYPVFLLAQTIPLLSNYFSNRLLSAITGKMLFFSTLGSFGGSVISTIILMTTIGVHNTLIFTMGLLALLVLLLTRRWWMFDNIIALSLLAAVIAMNSGATLRSINVINNNQYSMVKIFSGDEKDSRFMDINRSVSSKYTPHPEDRFSYLQFIEKNIINPARESSDAPKDFLVIGAGGFTLGVDDSKNNYTYVDIDKDLKTLSEKYLLPEPLGKNKRFVPMSARAFLTRDTQQYDFIMIDAYTNIKSVPMEVITREFLEKCKEHLKPQGVLISNLISRPGFEDRFTVRYHNTFRSVFPYFTTQLSHDINPWVKGKILTDNILYIYHHRPEFHEDNAIYTDDLNSYSLDR